MKGTAPTSDSPLSSSIREKLDHPTSGVQGQPIPIPEPRLWSDFTAREQEVVALLIAGKTKKEAARTLDLSPATVKAHLHSAFRKANVHGSVQLIARLYRLEAPKITGRPNGYLFHGKRREAA